MGLVLYIIIVTHITSLCNTIYLHRGQAHKSIELHPVLSHIMRFWIWFTTFGVNTKQWVAIHRIHHSNTDVEKDPHSPVIFGIRTFLYKGVYYYYKAIQDTFNVRLYGKGTPDDWIERKVYTPYPLLGAFLFLLLNILLYGVWGVLAWFIMMIWLPLFSGGVVNGFGHYFGYRNFDTKDNSHNFLPASLFFVGEQLHNNHHDDPSNAKFSKKWFEFDMGYFWIKLFSYVKLIKIKKDNNDSKTIIS